MQNLVYILGLCFLCVLFWQQRHQSELAKAAVERKCKQMGLQVLSVSFVGHKFRTPRGRWRWHTLYQFEFSSLGDDSYKGQLIMIGFRAFDFQFPAYRVDDII